MAVHAVIYAVLEFAVFVLENLPGKVKFQELRKRAGRMSVSDPIADTLTIIRNAAHVRKETVEFRASKLLERILSIFKNDGYIEDFRLLKDDKQGILKVYLKYDNNKPVIMGIKRISRPGLRVYADNGKIPRILNGLGTAVLSTSKGVISDREARKLKIGGEVLCAIW